MPLLGNDYIVLDKAAAINFLRPHMGKVLADFILTEDDIQTAVFATENNQVYEPSRTIEIKDSQGEIVAKVKKDLYICRNKSH